MHQNKMIGKKIDENNRAIALMFCILKKKKYIMLMFRQKQVYLLMISKWEAWHFMASVLWGWITSKHYGNFYCLNCLHSFATENKWESDKKVCENKDFSNFVMASEDTKISEFNHYQKFGKASFIVYADLECLIEKIDGCNNNPENSFTAKVSKHIPSGFSMSTTSSF